MLNIESGENKNYFWGQKFVWGGSKYWGLNKFGVKHFFG